MCLLGLRIVYILIYVVTAQVFYTFMQKPWNDCAMEASSAAAGVALASKGGLERVETRKGCQALKASN